MVGRQSFRGYFNSIELKITKNLRYRRSTRIYAVYYHYGVYGDGNIIFNIILYNIVIDLIRYDRYLKRYSFENVPWYTRPRIPSIILYYVIAYYYTIRKRGERERGDKYDVYSDFFFTRDTHYYYYYFEKIKDAKSVRR